MGEIPLIILNLQDEGYHLLVEIRMFNQSFKAVLDTGASKTVFDKACMETYVDPELIKRSEHLSTGLGTNTMESYTLVIPDLHIGPFHVQTYEVALLDLSTINVAYQSMEQDPVIGVIGGDLLKEYEAIIDYKKALLYLKLP